jgi:hypothetical protein
MPYQFFKDKISSIIATEHGKNLPAMLGSEKSSSWIKDLFVKKKKDKKQRSLFVVGRRYLIFEMRPLSFHKGHQ